MGFIFNFELEKKRFSPPKMELQEKVDFLLLAFFGERPFMNTNEMNEKTHAIPKEEKFHFHL